MNQKSLLHNDNFKWYLVRDNFLSPDECQSQMQYINDKVDKDEFVWGSLHNCKNVVTDDKNILNKIWKIAKLSNQLVFKFDIDSIQLQEGKYYKSGTYKEQNTLHSDFAAGPGRLVDTTTKLTSVVFLNDDYWGGELEIWGDKIESQQGRIVIFPAFAAHKVSQFYDKDRYTMLTWIQGNTFK